MIQKCKTVFSQKPIRYLLFPVLALIVFAIAGQISCGEIGEDLKGNWGTIAVTCTEILIIFVTVRYLSRKGRIRRILAWCSGVIAFSWMLFLSALLIATTPSSIETYGAPRWIGAVDKLEEEQRLWSLSHWFGPGEPYYEYDDSVVETAPQTEAQAIEEPYHSALNERLRAQETFRYYYSDTMLNVLSYLYGRWVWIIYLAIAIAWTAAGIWAFRQIHGVPARLLYSVSLLLITLLIWLPAFNGCGLRLTYFGPPFTGFGRLYWEYNLFTVGPPLGVILSLTPYSSLPGGSL